MEATYLRALSDACPIEVWREIVQKAVEQARQGDAGARCWLAKYLLGSADLRQTLTPDERIAHEPDPLEQAFQRAIMLRGVQVEG